VLCIHHIRPGDSSTAQALPLAMARPAHFRQKMGPLWKLMYIVEPAPQPSSALMLRDEKNELLMLDGPFAETKS
jgi:hypothetical protein